MNKEELGQNEAEKQREQLRYGFDVARQIVDTYVAQSDARLALEYIKQCEERCNSAENQS